MRYSVKQFEISSGDNDYGIVSSLQDIITIDDIKGSDNWVKVKDGIMYHIRTRSTPDNTSKKSITVKVAIPEQHPLFNNILILNILRARGVLGLRYHKGVTTTIISIVDLIAETLYKAGVPAGYKAYTLK